MSNATSWRAASRQPASSAAASARPSASAIFSVMAKTRWVEAISSVRSGVTKPRSTARAASISSEASTTSTSPGTGIRASTGSRPAACAASFGKQLDVVDRGAGALRDAGHRGGLREVAAVLREIDDPVRQHAAALAAERDDGDGDRRA